MILFDRNFLFNPRFARPNFQNGAMRETHLFGRKVKERARAQYVLDRILQSKGSQQGFYQDSHKERQGVDLHQSSFWPWGFCHTLLQPSNFLERRHAFPQPAFSSTTLESLSLSGNGKLHLSALAGADADSAFPQAHMFP